MKEYWTFLRRLIFLKAGVLNGGGDTEPIEPVIVNMFDYFWANGAVSLGAAVDSDTTVNTKYLLISGNQTDTTLTVDPLSPLAIADVGSGPRAGIIEYDNGDVDLVSVLVSDGALTIYPGLKTVVNNGKIYSLANGIHLSAAGYKYYADCFYRSSRRYSRKKEAIAQYNPFTSVTPNPLTKIGTFWWGKGQRNVCNSTFRVISNGMSDFLNLSFVTGATAQSPKGFSWEMDVTGKNGYFEMYIGGRDNTPMNAELGAGLEFNIEWYLDGVLKETVIKKTKRIEPIRFDFSEATTGKVRLFVTSGESNFEAHMTQATWWVTDDKDARIFNVKKVPLMFMDSWGVFHNNATQTELQALLAADRGTGVVINNSVGSTTSAWGVSNFDSKVLAEHPDYMISDFQINDISTGITVADYIQNMKSLINSSLSNGIIPVMLMSAHNTTLAIYSKYTFPFIASLAELP